MLGHQTGQKDEGISRTEGITELGYTGREGRNVYWGLSSCGLLPSKSKMC